MYMYPQGWTQRWLSTGGGGGGGTSSQRLERSGASHEQRGSMIEGAGSGDLRRIFFLNLCLSECISFWSPFFHVL